MTSNLVQRHVLWSYRPNKNLGQIDRNLQNMFLMTSYANQQYFFFLSMVKLAIQRERNRFPNLNPTPELILKGVSRGNRMYLEMSAKSLVVLDDLLWLRTGF